MRGVCDAGIYIDTHMICVISARRMTNWYMKIVCHLPMGKMIFSRNILNMYSQFHFDWNK